MRWDSHRTEGKVMAPLTEMSVSGWGGTQARPLVHGAGRWARPGALEVGVLQL